MGVFNDLRARGRRGGGGGDWQLGVWCGSQVVPRTVKWWLGSPVRGRHAARRGRVGADLVSGKRRRDRRRRAAWHLLKRRRFLIAVVKLVLT